MARITSGRHHSHQPGYMAGLLIREWRVAGLGTRACRSKCASRLRYHETGRKQAAEGAGYLPRIAPGPGTGRRLAMRPHSAVVPVFPLRPAPVEYAVAVPRYLAAAPLGAASRRIYQVSLTSWAWPLVGRPLQ